MSGVPEQAAKHALYNTGNNSADMAVMWFFDNMDRPGMIPYSNVDFYRVKLATISQKSK